MMKVRLLLVLGSLMMMPISASAAPGEQDSCTFELPLKPESTFDIIDCIARGQPVCVAFPPMTMRACTSNYCVDFDILLGKEIKPIPQGFPYFDIWGGTIVYGYDEDVRRNDIGVLEVILNFQVSVDCDDDGTETGAFGWLPK